MYLVALVTAFLAAESENRRLENLPQAHLAVTWKISSVGKDNVDEREYCALKVTSIIVFVIMIQRIFPFRAFSVNPLCDFYWGIVDFFIFIRQWSRLFFSVKGYCVYIINKISHDFINNWWGALGHCVLKTYKIFLVLLETKCKSTGSLMSILFKTPIFLFPTFFLLYFHTFRDKDSFCFPLI